MSIFNGEICTYRRYLCSLAKLTILSISTGCLLRETTHAHSSKSIITVCKEFHIKPASSIPFCIKRFVIATRFNLMTKSFIFVSHCFLLDVLNFDRVSVSYVVVKKIQNASFFTVCGIIKINDKSSN